MKRIIKLTESDLTRIVRRVINERQYLMEDDKGHDGQVIQISLPWTKNDAGAVIPARDAFLKPEYTPTFIYTPGMVETKAIKANNNLPVSKITKIVDNISGTEIPTYGAQTYDLASNSIRGRVSPPRDLKHKYSWDATKTSNYTASFENGGVINPIAVKFIQGTQYIQK